jgi:hypothetical protein
MNLSVYEFMEDYLNEDLPDYDRGEQLKEAVLEYNEVYGTAYDPERCLKTFKARFCIQ